MVSAESDDYDLSFEYDHNGIRTSKTETVHTYELIEHEWTVTVVEPTCTDDGYTLNACSCGNSYISNETTALGHDYTETTSGNDTIFTCSVCGHSYTQHTHNYSTTTVVAPTCTAKGYTLHVCACGHSYKTNETAALGHNFQLSVCTRCGYRKGSGGIIQPPVQPPVDIMSLDANETELVDGCEQYRITSTTEVRHDYIYASGKLLRETITTTVDGTVTDTDVLDFFYDQNGRPYSFTYNGAEYYYILNLQGDVERIYDTDGEEVALYNYNAWGEVINQSGTMADINPIRYRGYYYDAELGMYYLQSRYYDPVICRFINLDAFASTGQGFIGFNMFAYCGNNPVCNADESGALFFTALGAVTGFISGAVTAMATGQDQTTWFETACHGAIGGAIAGAGVDAGLLILGTAGTAAPAVAAAVTTAYVLGGIGNTYTTCATATAPPDAGTLIGSFLIGGTFNVLSFATGLGAVSSSIEGLFIRGIMDFQENLLVGVGIGLSTSVATTVGTSSPNGTNDSYTTSKKTTAKMRYSVGGEIKEIW